MTAVCKGVDMKAARCVWASSAASDGMQVLRWREDDMVLEAIERLDV